VPAPQARLIAGDGCLRDYRVVRFQN